MWLLVQIFLKLHQHCMARFSLQKLFAHLQLLDVAKSHFEMMVDVVLEVQLNIHHLQFISLQTNPRYHCTSSSIHTTTHISLTKELYCVSSVTQSKNFDRSSVVGRSKTEACDEVARQLLSPSNTKRFSKHSSCGIIILNVGSMFLSARCL